MSSELKNQHRQKENHKLEKLHQALELLAEYDIELEDVLDLLLIYKTRSEKTIPFSEYLKKHGNSVA
jgi:hypothetical protein